MYSLVFSMKYIVFRPSSASSSRAMSCSSLALGSFSQRSAKYRASAPGLLNPTLSLATGVIITRVRISHPAAEIYTHRSSCRIAPQNSESTWV